MIAFVLLILTSLFLAYTNGANDNFKGVATLFGSKTTSYKLALSWATITTLVGSLFSIFLAEELLKTFSGKGLVPDSLASAPTFLIAVGLGAALTVLIATITGFPISTTHSLTGALLGAGIAAIGFNVNFHKLGSTFMIPLLVSPLIALLLSAILYPLFKYFRRKLGLKKSLCICAVNSENRLIPITENSSLNMHSTVTQLATHGIVMNDEDYCVEEYNGKIIRIPLQKVMEVSHYLSSGLVCFARGLNDTPKIAGLLMVVHIFSIHWGMIGIAISIALGGILNTKKVAYKMSKDITPMNQGQGLAANMVTGFLVIFASKLGIPVSTTHVSVGSLFGIALVGKTANFKVIKNILLSWVLTLPLSALFSAGIYRLIAY
ncbi:inorganic phosphate transporter [bacterium]|jgi:inorganic phosphate transporter, PiT family|nr:inorganic phosphate transporter [bacterium]